MSEEVIIRSFQMQDISELCPLYAQLGYPVSATSLTRRLTKLLAQDHYQLLVAVLEGHVVGFVGFAKMYFFEADGCYMRILALVVDGGYRRQGLAQKLIEQVKKIAKENGVSALAVNSGINDSRTDAHQFYEKQGFQHASYGFKCRI